MESGKGDSFVLLNKANVLRYEFVPYRVLKASQNFLSAFLTEGLLEFTITPIRD